MPLNQLYLPTNDPVLGIPTPTVDGFVDNRDTTVTSSEAEDHGYATGPRIQYGNGVPYSNVIVSAVKGKNEDFAYLHFLVQNDDRWDDYDYIVLAIKPEHSPLSGAAQTIRADIAPLYDGVGAGSGPPPSSNYKIKSNQNRRAVQWWKGVGASQWTPFTSTPAATIKVRSWQLPSPPTPFVEDFGWAVEVKLPLKQAVAGAAQWEDLTESFALYFNVIRVETNGPTTSGDYLSTQFTWPRDDGTPRYLTGYLDDTLSIPNNYYGEVLVPDYGATSMPQGLKFHRGPDTLPQVGVRRGGQIGRIIDAAVNADNEFAAVVENTDPSLPGPPLEAEFHLANWGVGPPDINSWHKITATSGTNPADVPGPINPGATAEGSFHWKISQGDHQAYQGHSHQCMWVRLDAPSGGIANFTEAGVRVNMDFINLSRYKETAEISGKGHLTKPKSKKHLMRLVMHARLLQLDRRAFYQLREVHKELGKGEYEDWRFWTWFIDVQRDLNEDLTIEGQRTRAYEPVGSFGHVIAHLGPHDTLRADLSGSGLQSVDRGIWQLPVPDGRAAQLKYTLWTEPIKGEEDPWLPPGRNGEEGGDVPKEGDPWWKRLVLRRWPFDRRPYPRLPG